MNFKVFIHQRLRWGLKQEGGVAQEHLNEVELEILCNRECRKQFKSVKLITQRVVSEIKATFASKSRKDTCDGKEWIPGSDENIRDFMMCAGDSAVLVKI